MTVLDDYLMGFAHREAGTQPTPPLVDFAKRAILGLAGDDAIIERMARAAAAAVERKYESPTPGYIAFDAVEDVMPTAVRAALRVLGEPR